MEQQFVKITTEDQKIEYATQFDSDYQDYLSLKKREKEVRIMSREI